MCQKRVKIQSLFDKQFSLFLCKHEINNSFILKINPFDISGHVNQNLRQILSEQRLPTDVSVVPEIASDISTSSALITKLIDKKDTLVLRLSHQYKETLLLAHNLIEGV